MRIDVVLGGILLAVAACGSPAKAVATPAEPVEQPPLPPASGTPIGILIDAGADLGLRPEQLDQLHAIDRTLSTRNDAIDSQLRELDRPPESTGGPGGPGGGMGGPGGSMGGGGMGGPPMGGGGMGGGGMGGGGMGGGGMSGPPGGGGMAGPPGGGGHRRNSGAPGSDGSPPPPQGDPASRRKLMEEREANVRTAITRALDALDPPQRSRAMQILDEHGASESSPPPPPGGRPPGREPPMHGGPRRQDEPAPGEP